MGEGFDRRGCDLGPLAEARPRPSNSISCISLSRRRVKPRSSPKKQMPYSCIGSFARLFYSDNRPQKQTFARSMCYSRPQLKEKRAHKNPGSNTCVLDRWFFAAASLARTRSRRACNREMASEGSAGRPLVGARMASTTLHRYLGGGSLAGFPPALFRPPPAPAWGLAPALGGRWG